jgi:autotransporter-associated beta strand protein
VPVGGIIDFSRVTSGVPSAGSLAGTGTVYLGRNTLAVGARNTTTTFGGSILDGTVRGGSLQKTGSGTLSLTGISTWSGATIVAGQLAVIGGGRIDGTSNVTVANLATDTGSLRVSGLQSRVSTVGNVIIGNSGRGTLILEDGGTLTASTVLLGANAGASGTLNVGSGGAAGLLTATSVVSGAGTGSSVNINHSQSSYTLSSNLLGSISLNHNGTGTTTLMGTNGYSGGTYLNAGALRISTSTQLGVATGALYFNGGVLQAGAIITNFTHPTVLSTRGGTIDTGTFSVLATGAVSGTGRLTKTGSGTLTLNGTSTYTGGTTVSAGTLRGSAASLVGNITNNGAVAFLQTTEGTYSGVMSGSGTLTKANVGSLTLSGASTFTGGTTVSSGTLIVNGSLASAVNVGESGILGGTGTIRAPVTISGVLAPGVGGTGAMGTLTVANRVTFNPGMLYRVDADSSGRADRLDASGAVTINEAAVEVIANPTGTWGPTRRYTIITAGGGIAGQFTDVSTDLAFLTPSLSYDRSNVYLTLERNDTGFSSVAKTRKQSVTAKYLQALDSRPSDNDATSTVLDTVTQSSVEQARTTFDQLSGTDLTRASRVSRMNTAKVVDVLVTRLTQATPANQGIWMQSVAAGADELIREDGNSSFSRYGWRSTGVVTGFDAAVSDETVLGLSVSYTRSDVMLNERRDSYAEVSAPRAMLYATTDRGSTQLSGVATFSRPVYRTQRQMSYLGSDAATASHSAREISMYLEAASAYARGEAESIQPLVAVRYIRSFEAPYVEAGNVGGLAVQGRTAQVLTSELGTRYYRELQEQGGSIELRAAWSRDYADTFSNVSARLSSDVDGEAFAASDGGAPRDHFLVDLRLVARLRKQFSLRMDCSVDASLGGSVRRQIGIGFERTW